MNDKLRDAVQWTCFIAIVLFLLVGFFIPLCIYILYEDPPGKIITWMNYAGTGLSAVSLGLAVYSLRISSISQEKLEASLKNVESIQQGLSASILELKGTSDIIKNSQDRIENRLEAMKNIGDSKDAKNTSAWTHDATGTRE